MSNDKIVTIEGKEEPNSGLTKEELREAVQGMIDSYEGLPPGAMLTPITHYDLHSVLLLLEAFLRVV